MHKSNNIVVYVLRIQAKRNKSNDPGLLLREEAGLGFTYFGEALFH